jgi:hypothetical protein
VFSPVASVSVEISDKNGKSPAAVTWTPGLNLKYVQTALFPGFALVVRSSEYAGFVSKSFQSSVDITSFVRRYLVKGVHLQFRGSRRMISSSYFLP